MLRYWPFGAAWRFSGSLFLPGASLRPDPTTPSGTLPPNLDTLHENCIECGMSCVNMQGILRTARAESWAVGAFNVLDYASFRAVVRAAEKAAAPVIVQTSVKTVQLWGFAAMVAWYQELAGGSPVPVVLHLDHCKDPAFVRACIDAGWTSVMIDGSSRPFEENLAVTRQVVTMARKAGVSVEAELGEIGGVEDDIAVTGSDARLADPAKAEAFAAALDLDVLAPAIGTAHGIYKGEPKIAFDRIADIGARTGLPLALHGGTGLADDVFRRCISLGCAKVNISTHLKHVFIDSFLEYRAAHPGEYEPVKDIAFQMDKMAAPVEYYVRLFGGEGKAS
jgi:ketose-bisphosphate aldolase